MVVLSIIILSYNTKDLTFKCIESIVGQYRRELQQRLFEIIVVDNGSKDGTIEILKPFGIAQGGQVQNDKRDSGQARMTESARIIFIQNKENSGFAKGCNMGVSVAKGKYLLFLNSDTETKDRGFLKMTEFLEKNEKIGILGGKLLNTNGSSQPSGGNFYNLWNLFLMLIGGERFGLVRRSPIKIEKIDWVSGGCMMVKKSLFEKLSGFDENFFMYIEDMELCFRANKLGFLTYFYPNLGVLHKELGSSNRAFAIIHIYKGTIYFCRKHKGYLQYMCAKLLLTIKAYIAILVGSLTNNQYLATTYKKALKF